MREGGREGGSEAGRWTEGGREGRRAGGRVGGRDEERERDREPHRVDSNTGSTHPIPAKKPAWLLHLSDGLCMLSAQALQEGV